MGVQTIFEMTAGSDQKCSVIEAHITNVDSETSTQELMEIVRFATAGTGGTAITEEPLDPGDAAASFTAVEEPTVEGGTPTNLHLEAWNILTGWHYVPVPEARIRLEGGDILGIRIAEALEATVSLVGYVVVQED
jgi:hypothetical protein